MTPNPTPKYVYKIIPSAPPEPIPAEYPLSELDQNDGFVHLSTATQVPKTADLFFQEFSTLWVLKMELAKFASPTKWEGGFPHLYGNFGVKDVHSVEKFERANGTSWSDTMKHFIWLE